MFMGLCIAILGQKMSNKIQLYTVKLIHMFQVVSPPVAIMEELRIQSQLLMQAEALVLQPA